MGNTIPGVVTTLFSWFIRIVYKKSYKSVMVESNRADLELVGTWLRNVDIHCPIDSTHSIKDFDNQENDKRVPSNLDELSSKWKMVGRNLVLRPFSRIS